MKALHMVAWILVIIGGLNWGLVGIGGFAGGNWNLVAWVASYIGGMQVEAAIYVIVGLAAIYEIATHGKNCRMCSAKSGM